MNLDKHTLNLAAAGLSCAGAAVALLSALFGRNRGSGAVLPAILGVVGSAAWTMSALQDMQDADAELA